LDLTSSSQEELFARATAAEDDASQLPRTILVFAHPDDETVALGARLGRFGQAHFVHVTDGAPRNERDSRWHGFASWREYREARAREFDCLLAAARIETATRECLEIPDQDASYHLPDLARRVAQLIADHQPEVVFTHPFEGGHPDHDACAFAVHHALRLRNASYNPPALVIEGAFYNAASPQPGGFVPRSDAALRREYRLTPEERRRKQARIDCFLSQKETLSGFPLDCERFRLAPDYDFTHPPHPPPLLYDRYPWGMTSNRFIQLASEAEELLHDKAR
jgi:LmbE family N-acetylglucosaminyl deacetylase